MKEMLKGLKEEFNKKPYINKVYYDTKNRYLEIYPNKNTNFYSIEGVLGDLLYSAEDNFLYYNREKIKFKITNLIHFNTNIYKLVIKLNKHIDIK